MKRFPRSRHGGQAPEPSVGNATSSTNLCTAVHAWVKPDEPTIRGFVEMSSIHYQRHIDGLRALAVILVILHHLGDWAGLSGGYVGVDVFFVISGFLITSIVKAEIDAQRFSFGGFYRRRVIRLAPAYFTVLITTTIAALVWMLPAEMIAYARSAAASSLFIANFHMWREVGGYFGAASETTPLLHLWSLAVEEQFYLFWPLMLLLGHRWLGLRWMAFLVVAITLGGIAVSQWGVMRFPAAAYYLLPTRFFELSAGAALAYLPVARVGRLLRTLVSACGLGLILYASVSYGRETLFPGYAGLAPVLGTLLLLRYGAGAGVVGAILSAPLSILLGRISYPAYLWHWPVIAFLNLNEVPITYFVGSTVFLATFVLAWLTYQVVELPARKFIDVPEWKVIFVGAAAPIAASVAASVAVIHMQGLPSRFPDSLNLKSEALLAYPHLLRGRCNEGPPTSPLPPDDCVLGRPYGDVDFLLVGDSHANHFTGFLDELGSAAEMRGYDLTRSQTAFLPGIDFWTPREGKPEQHRNFVPRNNYISGLLRREKYRFIVLAGAWNGYFTAGTFIKRGPIEGEEAFKEGMREAIKEAKAAAQTVVVLQTVPGLPAGLHDCSLRNERFGHSHDCSLSVERYEAQVAGVGSFFQELKADFPEVVWIDPALIMCEAGRCATEIDGLPLYKDGGHLNDLGSRLLAQKWLARFGNPLNPTREQAPLGATVMR